jgi:hypothetical protein
MGRINKTSYYFNWADGHYKVRELTRSFDTLEEAQKFAENRKEYHDIYISKGKYKVVWLKTVAIEE